MDLSDQTMELDELESGNALLTPNGPLLGPVYSNDRTIDRIDDGNYPPGSQLGGAPLLRSNVVISDRATQSAEQGGDVLKPFQTRNKLRRGEHRNVVQTLGVPSTNEPVHLHDSSPVLATPDPVARNESTLQAGVPVESSDGIQHTSTFLHQSGQEVQPCLEQVSPFPRLPPFSTLLNSCKDAIVVPSNLDAHPRVLEAQPPVRGSADADVPQPTRGHRPGLVDGGIDHNLTQPNPPFIQKVSSLKQLEIPLQLVPKPTFDLRSTPPTIPGGKPPSLEVVEPVYAATSSQRRTDDSRSYGSRLPFPPPQKGECPGSSNASNPRPHSPAAMSVDLPEQQESVQILTHGQQPPRAELPRYTQPTPTEVPKSGTGEGGDVPRKGRFSLEDLAKENAVFPKIEAELKALSRELNRPLQTTVHRLVDFLCVKTAIPRSGNTFNLYQKYFAKHGDEEERSAGQKGCKACYRHFSDLHSRKGESWPDVVQMLCEKEGLLALDNADSDDQKRYFKILMKTLQTEAMNASKRNFHLAALVVSGDRSDPSLTGAIPPPDVPKFFDDNLLTLTKSEIITVLQHHVEAAQLEQIRDNVTKPHNSPPDPEVSEQEDDDVDGGMGAPALSTSGQIDPEAMRLTAMKGESKTTFYHICRNAMAKLLELASDGAFKCGVGTAKVTAPWRELSEKCVHYGLVMELWPIEVPLPPDVSLKTTAGLRELPSDQLRILAMAFHGPPGQRIRVIKLTNDKDREDLKNGIRPVITTTPPQHDSRFSRARSLYWKGKDKTDIRIEEDGEPRRPPPMEPTRLSYKFAPPIQPPPIQLPSLPPPPPSRRVGTSSTVTRRRETSARKPIQEGGGPMGGLPSHYNGALGPTVKTRTSEPNRARAPTNVSNDVSERNLGSRLHHRGVGETLPAVVSQQTNVWAPSTSAQDQRTSLYPTPRTFMDQPTHYDLSQQSSRPLLFSTGASWARATPQPQPPVTNQHQLPPTETDIGRQDGVASSSRAAQPYRHRLTHKVRDQRRFSPIEASNARYQPYGRGSHLEASHPSSSRTQLSIISEDNFRTFE